MRPPDTIETTLEQVLRPLSGHESKNAPSTVYLRGDSSLLSPKLARVAVVGSRKASSLGLRRVQKLARILARENIVVVSGLALGIDSAAHEESIRTGGRTIGVLGSPVETCYPGRNRRLYEEIAQRHLLLSQFPEGFPIRRGNFPMRNRTMAIISDASVIVEAGDSSGSLSQGWEALRLNRPLFIMKSVLDNEDLDWPKEMIEYGAQILETEEPLLDLLKDLSEPSEIAMAI